VYNLLGGLVRDRVRTYANGWSSGLWRRTKVITPADYADCAREIVAKGYDALKFDPWVPAGDKAWYTCDSREGRLAVERVAAIREAVGPDVDVLIEVHGRFNVYTALEYARLMAPYRPMFFEEPVIPENMDLMVEVRRGADIPIATGERLYTKFDYLRLAELHAADIVQPDLTHAGGIMEMKKIAAIMEARSIPVAPHNSSGPVATMAAVHVDLSIPNFLIQECFADFTPPWWQEAIKEPITVVGGYIEAPTKPGLGVEFNEEIVAAHPFQEIPHTVRYPGE
jgi:galactonate dehydratase